MYNSLKRIQTKMKLLSLLIKSGSKDFDECIKACEEALSYSVKKEVEYTILGTLYHSQNNFDEAIKYYNLAIEQNDNYDFAYEGRNQAMLENHLKILDLQDELIKRELKF